MKKIILSLIILTISIAAKEPEKEIKMGDLRNLGAYNDIESFALEGRKLDQVYVDKIKWNYQPTSEHPYSGIAYKIYWFKKKNNTIINYQMVSEIEENYDKAYYTWENDSLAIVKFSDSSKKNPDMLLNAEQQKMGGVPSDYKETK